MLISMKQLLETAQSKKFAVGAFNICDSLLFETVLCCAEKEEAPVIIQLAPPEFEYVGESFFRYMIAEMEKSKVPCTLHLDHGKTMSDCVKAIRCGFTSIMIDGSELEYEENIRITQKVCEIAHCVGVSVEAEIGTIGSLESSVEGGASDIIYTVPEQTVDFIEKTKVDALAVAIGTAHGIYPPGFVPKLRIDILKEIKEMIKTPLVLHGGSSNKDEEIVEACQHGICKVNIASDYRKAFFEGVKQKLIRTNAFWTPNVYDEAIMDAQKVIAHKMELFGCIGKMNLY